MTRTMEYRALATEVHARAAKESDPRITVEWENLALIYAQLAEQANMVREADPVDDLLNRIRH
jgi:hypothetical protein